MSEDTASKQKIRRPIFRRFKRFVLRCFGKISNDGATSEVRPVDVQSIKSVDIEGINAALPREIWTNIFHLVVNDALHDIHTRPFEVIREYTSSAGPGPVLRAKLYLTPVVLSHVCRYWSAMIMSDPLFWNRVFVNPHLPSSQHQLATWLTRSQSVPVSIFLDGARSYSIPYEDWNVGFVYTPESVIFRSCIAIINQHSWHTEFISFRSDIKALTAWIHTLDEDAKFPMLHSLEVRVMEERNRTSISRNACGLEQMFITSFSDWCCPSLTNLTFGDGYFDAHKPYAPFSSSIPLGFPPKFTGIVSLTLKSVEVEELGQVLQVLRQMPRLRILWLITVSFYPANFDFIEIIFMRDVRTTLQSLQELHCVNTYKYVNRDGVLGGDITRFLDRVACPALATLTLDWGTYSDLPNDNWESLTEFVTQSQCTIRRLTLRYAYRQNPAVVPLLCSQICAELEELTIVPWFWLDHDTICLLDGSHRVFENINDPSERYITPLFPSTLKRLVLYGCVVENGVLAQMARSRMQDCALEYLYVEVKGLHPDKHSEEIEAFKELRRLGYKAHLQSTPNSTIQCLDAFTDEWPDWLDPEDKDRLQIDSPTANVLFKEIL